MQSMGTKAIICKNWGIPDKKCLVLDDHLFLSEQTQLLAGFDSYLLDAFEPNGQAAIFSVATDKKEAAFAKFKCLALQKKAHSIITYRASKKQDIERQENFIIALTQTKIVAIPSCGNFVYAHWLRLLAGEPDARVFPQYFFATPDEHEQEFELEKWTKAFAELSVEILLTSDTRAFVDQEWLESKTGLFGTELWKSSKRLFGNPPGTVMRTCRIFLLFIECLRREQLYFEKYGKRRSALPDMPGDFRRSLQRVFGISYSEIRKGIYNPTYSSE